jgi:formylglycine-generating enzyme required for sulfatase activity
MGRLAALTSIILAGMSISVLAQDSSRADFKVLAFYGEDFGHEAHKYLTHGLWTFFTRLSSKQNFTFEATSDLANMNDTFLKNYQVVMWINIRPQDKEQREAFRRYMENGGGWIGFHQVWLHGRGDSWPWFEDFMGTRRYRISRPSLPARLKVEDKTHPAVQNIPGYISAPPDEWIQWNPSPRDAKDIKILMTLDPMNYPLGINTILVGGDTPVVWTNTNFNMVYINMGHDSLSMSDHLQNRIFKNALMWIAKKSAKDNVEPLPDSTNMPEMIPVQGAAFTMGEDAGDKDSKPAHSVSVSDFRIAKTETTIGQWRKFCTATSRKMPEEPWFKQSDQHPVVNVSWDHAMAYCQWLTDVTGKHYRLPTEAEWEFAARGGVTSKGFPYSGSNVPDSVAWVGRKTDGTMPVAQKAPNELGLYDMTGNVWEWCSDWYAVEYYAVSVKENPKGPESGQFYTLRGGAWDIGLRNNRIVYRNPLAPMSRNHNKGFRVACDE